MREIASAAAAALWLLASPQIASAQGTPAVDTILYQVADGLGLLRTPEKSTGP